MPDSQELLKVASLAPLSPQQLDAFADEHVKYEAQMLVGATCRQYDLARPDRTDQLGVWACLESALFHLRNLRVFLLDRGRINEVVARDYLPAWRSSFGMAPESAIKGRLSAATQPLNEHLAHLTRSRLEKHYEWDTPGACDDVLVLLKTLRSKLAESPMRERSASFSWIDDLTQLWGQARPPVERFESDEGELVICRRIR